MRQKDAMNGMMRIPILMTEIADVVIAFLCLGDDQGSLFTNSIWFSFDEEVKTMTVKLPPGMYELCRSSPISEELAFPRK